MKPKTLGKKSPTKDVKPTFDIKVLDHKFLGLQKLISQRKFITRKINNLPKLEQRLRIENPGLSLQQLLERLTKQKNAVDKALTKYNSSSKRTKTELSLPRTERIMFFRELAPLSIEEILEKQYNRVRPDWRDIFSQPTCPRIQGRARPYLTRIGATVSALNDLNHNSSADYLVMEQRYSDNFSFSYSIGAWLNDDASIWRDDSPDSVMWYDNLCMDLPIVQCDSTVVARFSIRFQGDISSEADDHNEISQYVYVVHSDENGNLPPYVSFGDEYILNVLDLSGEIGLPFGNRFDSERVTVDMSFNVKSDVIPKIAVANCTRLKAQDGTLAIKGSWQISYLVYSITPA